MQIKQNFGVSPKCSVFEASDYRVTVGWEAFGIRKFPYETRYLG
jgi:hypothetical protein